MQKYEKYGRIDFFTNFVAVYKTSIITIPMNKYFKIILIFLCLSLCPMMQSRLFAQNVEVDILQAIHNTRTPTGTIIMKGFSTSAYAFSIAVPLVELTLGLAARNRNYTISGVQASAGIVLAMGLSTGLKYIIGRPRPYDRYSAFITPLQLESTYSLPSGHSVSAFATATTLALQYRKWYVAVPAFLWAGTVAYSRMYLGVHYPTDIVAGMLLGIGTAYFTYKMQQKLAPKVPVPLSFR